MYAVECSGKCKKAQSFTRDNASKTSGENSPDIINTHSISFINFVGRINYIHIHKFWVPISVIYLCLLLILLENLLNAFSGVCVAECKPHISIVPPSG